MQVGWDPGYEIQSMIRDGLNQWDSLDLEADPKYVVPEGRDGSQEGATVVMMLPLLYLP